MAWEPRELAEGKVTAYASPFRRVGQVRARRVYETWSIPCMASLPYTDIELAEPGGSHKWYARQGQTLLTSPQLRIRPPMSTAEPAL